MRSIVCLSILAFATTILFAACSAPPDPVEDGGVIGGCRLPYVGDPNLPMEVDVVAIAPGYTLVPVTEGSDVTLMWPPQGGRVVFAGVRVRNLNPCGVRLTGALRDPVSQQVRLDSRIINLIVTEDGYGECDPSDIFTFANIPACHNQWSEQDLMDVPYELTVSLTDRDDRKVTRVLQVVPRCDEPGQVEACRCECDADYILGMMCLPTDGGLSDATVEDAPGD